MLAWASRGDLPALLLLTKADKLGRGAARSAQLAVEREVRGMHGSGSPVQVMTFSARETTAVGPVQALLDRWLDVPARR
jgi:GTP-binding protein